MSQSSFSENILNELQRISEELRIGLFEAAGEYCTEHDLDEFDFIKKLDQNAIDQIKFSAINSGAVRKCVEKAPASLF